MTAMLDNPNSSKPALTLFKKPMAAPPVVPARSIDLDAILSRRNIDTERRLINLFPEITHTSMKAIV